jgi:hypothetical protein
LDVETAPSTDEVRGRTLLVMSALGLTLLLRRGARARSGVAREALLQGDVAHVLLDGRSGSGSDGALNEASLKRRAVTVSCFHTLTCCLVALILISGAASGFEVRGALPRSCAVSVGVEAGALSTGLTIDVVDRRTIAPAAVGVRDAVFARVRPLSALIIVARASAQARGALNEDLVREEVSILLHVDHAVGELGEEELALRGQALGESENMLCAVGGHGRGDRGGSSCVKLRGISHGDEGSFGSRETGDIADGGQFLSGCGSRSSDVNNHDVIVLVVL